MTRHARALTACSSRQLQIGTCKPPSATTPRQCSPGKHSWRPLFLALAAAIATLGIAVGWWLFLMGVLAVVFASVGFVLEVYRGNPRSGHAQGFGAAQVAPISIADRAIRVGPILGIGSSMSWRMLPRLSRTPVMSRLVVA